MRGTSKQHGFLHIGANLVAKRALGQMGQIHPIVTLGGKATLTFGRPAGLLETSWPPGKISLFSPLHGIPSRKMYCGLFQEKKLASGGLRPPPAESIEDPGKGGSKSK